MLAQVGADRSRSRNAGSNTHVEAGRTARSTGTRSRLLAVLKTSESGSLRRPAGRVRAARRARERSMSDCSSVLPPRDTATFVRSFWRASRSAASTCASVGFSSDASWYSTSGLFVALGGRRSGGRGTRAPATRASSRDRAPAGRRAVVGVGAERLGVFDDRAVVVLELLRALAGAQRRRRRAAARQHRRQPRQPPPSAPPPASASVLARHW